MLVGKGEFIVDGKPPAVEVQRFSYWDSATGHVRAIACWSNSVVEEGIVEAQTANGFVGIYRMTAPGVVPFEGRFRIDHQDANSYVIVFLDGPREGEVLGKWRRDVQVEND